jgi:hypothetical protein
MHTISPKIAKQKKFDHSLWENVERWSPCVAGAYVDLQDLVTAAQAGRTFTTTFEINLPITDIMCLQAFTLYPVFTLGALDLHCYVKRDGLVWAQCNPEAVFEKHLFFNDFNLTDQPLASSPYPRGSLQDLEAINIDQFSLRAAASQIKHGFTQIDNSARICINPKDCYHTGFKELTLRCQNMRITRCNTTVIGFKIQDSSKQRISNFFSTTRYLPSQKLDYYAFPHLPNQNGINSSINAPLVNCSFISFMFPRNPNDKTVFENIMYKNIQVTIMNKNYPDEPITTTGARFLQLQMVASELDGAIEPTAEYERSLIEEKNYSDTQKRRLNTTADASSFMLNIQLERSGAGYCFDGIDTNGQNVLIQLKGDPIISGSEDTFYNYQRTVTWDSQGNPDVRVDHPAAPEAWICRECFWELDNKGMRFMDTGLPPGAQANY